jgi:molecular chaperone DnaK
MQAEQDDYNEWLLDHPEAGDGASASSDAKLTKIGIDMGSSTVKCSHLPPTSTTPTLVEDREGGRSTASYVYFDKSSSNDDDDFGEPVAGKMAKTRLHSSKEQYNVVSPLMSLLKVDGTDQTRDGFACAASAVMLGQVVIEAVEKRTGGKVQEVEGILTYPPQFTEIQRNALYGAACAVGFVDPRLVVAPVAVLKAAKILGILKGEQLGKPSLVIDVGHSMSTLSIVNAGGDEVTATSSLEMGGEYVEASLVKHLGNKFKASNNINILEDSLAVARLHESASEAIKELSKKTRCVIEIPFITADQTGPKHLHETVSRSVVSTIANEYIEETGSLKAKDIATLVSNNLLSLLTESKLTPFSLGSILVVGGASRQHHFQAGIRTAVSGIGGEDYAAKTLVIADSDVCEELAVLGATLC